VITLRDYFLWVTSICGLQLLGSSGILFAGIAWDRICSTALVSQTVLVNETVLVSETALASQTVLVGQTVLVLSETVLVLVIESSLSWRYVRSAIELPMKGTKLGHFPFPEHEQETRRESQPYRPLFFLNSLSFQLRLVAVGSTFKM
jgi:hypothetical protein